MFFAEKVKKSFISLQRDKISSISPRHRHIVGQEALIVVAALSAVYASDVLAHRSLVTVKFKMIGHAGTLSENLF